MLGVLREPGNVSGFGVPGKATGRRTAPLPLLASRTCYGLSGMTSSRSKRIWSSVGTTGTSRSRNVIGFLS
jgi:hypothetical protein